MQSRPVRDYCSSVWCREDTRWNNRSLHDQEVLPGAVHIFVGISPSLSRPLSLGRCHRLTIAFCLCSLSAFRVSVMQWRQQFMQWSNITDKQIAVFTADQKEKVSDRHSARPHMRAYACV